MTSRPTSFKAIRSWDGSQNRAFEELCYQLRDPTPEGWQLWKPGNPDGGYEWYHRHRNGTERGWQVKFAFSIDDLLPLMKESVVSVAKRRPNCRRLTFCIPIDLPDSFDPPKRKSALQRYKEATAAWVRTIPGADKIRFELQSGGDVLERLNRPEHVGTARFFWDQELFGPDWMGARLAAARVIASDRYQPKLNVELPVANAIEGLGRSPTFDRQYRERRGTLVRAAERIISGRFADAGATPAFRSLVVELRALDDAMPEDGVRNGLFERRKMIAWLSVLPRLISAARPNSAERDSPASGLVYALRELSRQGSRFHSFLQTSAARTAESGLLLLTGEAGQGKTHLFCDAIDRVVADGRPGAVVFGGSFSGARPFEDLASALALGNIGGAELFGAMRSAAEASGSPFVLLIDALNDARDSYRWEFDLPALIAETELHFPWITLGVSVREAYIDLIESDASARMTKVRHPGLVGREYEAISRYFAAAGLDLPRTPPMLAEFSNPLFLKLYCEGFGEGEAADASDGHGHITQVFDRFLTAKSKRIERKLRLSPGQSVVAKSLKAFARAIPTDRREVVRVDEARSLVDAFAPTRTEWPNTLYGALFSEGVLSEDVAYFEDSDGSPEVASLITFQRLSDYLSAEALIEDVACADELRRRSTGGQDLHDPLSHARTGVTQALSVLIPERFGIEMLDLPLSDAPVRAARRRRDAFLESIVARRDGSATGRTVELFGEVSSQSIELYEAALRVLVSVAARPRHILNAEYLHEYLKTKSLIARDTTWGFATYDWLDDNEPIDRLIRWLRNGPSVAASNVDIELAAIPLVWVLSSPNRYLRDYVTKVLATGLANRIEVLGALLERFADVNDPYVLQRLAIATHGAVLLGGSRQIEAAAACCRQLREIARDPNVVPDTLVRDAAHGVSEWCYRAGVTDDAEHLLSRPPYGSPPPGPSRNEDELAAEFERLRAGNEPGYGSLFGSIFSYGDFGRYVIESAMRHFTRWPLSDPVPDPVYEEYDPASDRLAEILGEDIEETESEPIMIRRYDPERLYPVALARTWIFERVVEIGWTPEQFGDFDRSVSRRSSGRESHKSERFGKKYQWIAYHELIARLSDNFWLADEVDDRPEEYIGPAQLRDRDLDPTLPPAERTRDDDDLVVLSETFVSDNESDWWAPTAPIFAREDLPVSRTWAEDADGLPTLQSALVSTDPDGTEWITLYAHLSWDEERIEDVDHYERERRDLWGHLFTWLVRPDDADVAFQYLRTHTLMGRWMPEARDLIDVAYLAEIPHAAAASRKPAEWEPMGRSDGSPDVEVLAAWDGYAWEGNILDCSLEDGVSVQLPAELLFTKGHLSWIPGTTSWAGPDGVVAAQYRVSPDGAHKALLVQADWLIKTTASLGLCVIAGLFGEKHLLAGGFGAGLVGGWTEYNAVALLRDGAWTLDARREQVQTRSED